MALLLHLTGIDETKWRQRLAKTLGDYPIVLSHEAHAPADVHYMLAWRPDADAFEGKTNLKAILSLGAGVDALLSHPSLPQDVPIVRFVEEELSQCMSDYIVSQVSMHQRLHTRYASDQRAHKWTQHYPAPAWDIRVGVMGLGVLGTHALARLKPLGYQLNGWSRRQKTIHGVNCFAGAEGLDAFLGQTDILVCLLPLTDKTRGILNYANFKKLPRDGLKGGPALINAARGGHQNEADIARALGDGTLGAASLDVFEVEPLPAESPLWGLDNCYITPHIAAISNPNSGARYFARVIEAHEAGQPLVNLVDRNIGY